MAEARAGIPGGVPTPTSLLGRWEIESMDLWDAEAINLLEQGHITFTADGAHMLFICVNLGLDCRPKGRAGTAAEFTFEGDDEGTPTSGLGHAKLVGADRIEGVIRFHRGDESGFSARRAPGT